MERRLPATFLVLCLLTGAAPAATPVVSNVSMTARCADPTMVDITFTLADAEGDSCWIFPFGHNPTTREHIPMACFAVQAGGVVPLLVL